MYRYFVYICAISAISGALASSIFKEETLQLALFSFYTAIALLLFHRFQWCMALSISLVIVSIVLCRSSFLFPPSLLTEFSAQTISIRGIVIGEPDIREINTRIIVQADRINIFDSVRYVDEKIIATIPTYPTFMAGDTISLVGKLQVPKNFENENGIEFAYVDFLAKDNIYTQLYYPAVTLIEQRRGTLQNFLFSIKQSMLQQIAAVMPSPESELLGGILLGVKQSLGKELEKDFRRVGLIHIVVLSGYNITIIADTILKSLRFLPRHIASVLGGSSIILFALMVGSGATVIRSVVMALLALVAQTYGRTYAVNRALFAAGTIMIIHNPSIVLHDPSFQLSFLATLGLIHIGVRIKRFFMWMPEKLNLREITISTFSTQIAVLPLLILKTGEISIVSPIVNIITLQIIPFTMGMGFIAGLLGFVHQSIGMFFGFIPYLCLKYILTIVRIFSELHFATIHF